MAAKRSSTSQVTGLVLAVAFGLIALAVTYSAALRSTEQRSRAAEGLTLVKQWEFNGTTTEGWNVVGFANTRVADGFLRAVFGKPKQEAFLQNSNVGANLPFGTKYFRLRLAISKGSTKNLVTGTVTYELEGNKTRTRPLTFSINPDGTLRYYSLTLPEIAATSVTGLKVSFSGIKPGSQLEVDFMRLFGTMPKPTPIPTVICKTGVNSFSVDTPCDGGYRYMTYKCYDGYGRREGGPTSCKPSDVWRKYAEGYCSGRSNCPVPSKSPIPTSISIYPRPSSSPFPSASCGPVVCEVPPPGCYYTGATSCSCGILVCSVQKVTPTPTPTPSSQAF